MRAKVEGIPGGAQCAFGSPNRITLRETGFASPRVDAQRLRLLPPADLTPTNPTGFGDTPPILTYTRSC